MRNDILDKNNGTRHFVSTELQDRLPNNLIESVLGHSISGFDSFDRWSTTSGRVLTETATALDALLETICPATLSFSPQTDARLLPSSVTKHDPADRTPQDSFLPNKDHNMMFMGTVKSMADFLWSEWLSLPRTVEELQFAALFTLITDAGFQRDTLELLGKTTVSDLGKDGSLSLVIHTEDTGTGRCTLTLPCTTRLLLAALHARISPTSEDQLFSLLTATRKKHRDLLRPIVEHYRSFSCAFAVTQPDLPVPSLSQLLDIVPTLAWQQGLPAWVLTVVSHPPFPRSALTQSSLVSDHGIYFSHVPARPRSKRITGKKAVKKSWQDEARMLLRKLLQDLYAITDGHYEPINQLPNALTMIDAALHSADAICPETSALHLVIDWLHYKLAKKNGRIKVSSLETYLERTTFTSLLADDTDSYDLSTWDNEDFIQLVEERLDEENLGPKTLTDTLANFEELLKFGANAGYYDPVDLSELTGHWQGNSSPPPLITLPEFERYLQHCLEPDTREALAEACRAVLMFYGTLRPVELSRLSLADVYGDENDWYVDIHRSKTVAGRRRVILSALASPAALAVIQRYHALRQAEFTDLPDRPWGAIPLFGPTARAEAYTPTQIGTMVANNLRPWFGPGFVSYHLRHAAISWLYLRWAALRFPGLLETLPERHAPVFQPELQDRLLALFTDCPEDGHIPESDPSGLYLLAKLCGHISPSTTFRFYIHTFSRVHRFVMQQHDQVMGARTLSGKVIGQLLPGARSRTTQSKLPGKRLIDLCAHVNNTA